MTSTLFNFIDYHANQSLLKKNANLNGKYPYGMVKSCLIVEMVEFPIQRKMVAFDFRLELYTVLSQKWWCWVVWWFQKHPRNHISFYCTTKKKNDGIYSYASHYHCSPLVFNNKRLLFTVARHVSGCCCWCWNLMSNLHIPLLVTCVSFGVE